MKTSLEIKKAINAIEFTGEILEIINNIKNLYFTSKGIQFEFLRKYGMTMRGRPKSDMTLSNDLKFKMTLSCKIGHITRKLNKFNYIEKVSRKQWKKIKKINIFHMNLYTKKEQEQLFKQ